MPYLKPTVGALVFLLFSSSAAALAGAEDAFQSRVMPFLSTYCLKCHNPKTTEGALDLTRYTSSAALGEHFRQWETIVTFLKKGEMPPEQAAQPASALRAEVLETIENLMAAEAKKLSGDPGVVLPRRLSSAEYNYTIRDLTGIDIRPADSFPIDPASGEGFNNTGEALVMSPNLFKKYYAAAQHVAEHVALTPSGMRFAPFPVVTFADQTKLYEQALIRFYEQHDVDYKKYLMALWSYRYRPPGSQAVMLNDWATRQQLSPRYLAILSDVLAGSSEDTSYLGWVRQRWESLPPPVDLANPVAPAELASRIAELSEYIRRISRMVCAKETPAIVPNAGNAPPLHIGRRKKSAAERDTFDEAAISDRRRLRLDYRNLHKRSSVTIWLRAKNLQDGSPVSYVILKDLNFSALPEQNYRPANNNNLPLLKLLAEHAAAESSQWKVGVHPLGKAIDPGCIVLSTEAPLELKLPTAGFGKQQSLTLYLDATLDPENSPSAAVAVELSDGPSAVDDPPHLLVDPRSPLRESIKESCARLCKAFPNRFVFVDETRGLTAGFHLVEGFFRDDVPLCKLVLNDDQRVELDRLWDELYFGPNLMEKMLRGFVFYEREERKYLRHPDFIAFKAEDPELVKNDVLEQFQQIYVQRFNFKLDETQFSEPPIEPFFREIRTGLKRRAAQLADATPIYRHQLLELAERAYRRPLTKAERSQLTEFFDGTCRQPEFGVEQAVRGVVTSLLMSPYFCCRVDIPPAGESVKPLADLALASRLSYFLWSSMPDGELLDVAKAGQLNDEAALRRQVRRMVQDGRVSGLALEFFGQWLRYRDFNGEESVDRKVFPTFNDALKQAMFEEPTRLATYLMQNNLPVTDLLYGDTTLVNKPLAAHYGLTYRADGDEWQRVDGMQQRGRGGWLGMAVFLTKNSQPQRTSPVKRGFWVVHKVLGEHIPPPPANVAALPPKETDTDGKTIRQLLAAHTDTEACARCHRRFDPVGLSMEGFDPIGRSRDKDLAGRPVDNLVRLPSGEEARGVPEFLKYLQANRNDEFIKTLCHNFLGYALGRSLELSDQELLDKMQAELRHHDYRFGALIETVVCSPQFRRQRCKDFTLARFRAEFQKD